MFFLFVLWRLWQAKDVKLTTICPTDHADGRGTPREEDRIRGPGGRGLHPQESLDLGGQGLRQTRHGASLWEGPVRVVAGGCFEVGSTGCGCGEVKSDPRSLWGDPSELRGSPWCWRVRGQRLGAASWGQKA